MLRSSMLLGGAAFTVWNPNDKNAGVVLSQGNLRATVAGASYEAVRAINPRISGKWYFEATLVSTLADAATLGVMRSTASLASFVGGDANGYGYASDGFIYSGGVAVSALQTGWTNAGTVICVAVDLDIRKIYFRVNGGAWTETGDPVAGTGGRSIWATVPVYPAVGPRNGQGMTANFGASAFAQTAPTGFRAWGS